MRAIKLIFFSLFAFFGILYILFLSYVYFNQEEMIFHPSKLEKGYRFNFAQPFEELKIPTEDGSILSGVLFKANQTKGLIFYLHGNAGALDSWGEMAGNYTALGYDIFILDYRGFGKSGGTINGEAQLHNDISTAYKNLLKGYQERDVIVIGYSIGTGPAAYLSASNKPAALILQAPYYNLSELADVRVPFIPDFIKKYKFETNVLLPKIKCPVYIFHGTDDRIISYQNSVRLSKILRPSDHFYTLEGEGHGGMNDNPEYLAHLKELFGNSKNK